MLVLIIAVVAAQAQAPNPYLEQARSAYRDFDYAGCLKASELAGRLEREPATQASIEILHAMCAFELGRRAEAAERLELALRIDPATKLPPVVSPKIEAMFQGIRDRIGVQPPVVKEPAPPKEEVKPAAPKEDVKPVTVPEPTAAVVVDLKSNPSPVITYVPSAILAAVGVVGGGLGAYFGVRAQGLAAQNQAGVYGSDIGAFAAQAKQSALLANVSFVAAGVFVAAALIAIFAQY